MKLRKNMLLLQTAAVLALATGLAAPVHAAEVDTTQQTSLTIALAEDDTTDVQKSIVADLSRSGAAVYRRVVPRSQLHGRGNPGRRC